MTLGQEIKRLRKQSGLTQVELAERLGVTQAYITNIENGHRSNLHQELWLKLCSALGVPLDHFAKYISPDVQVPPPPGPQLLDLSRATPVPIIGVIGAGPAIDDPAEPGERVYLSKLFSGEVAGYQVRGDSMRDELIADGDYIVIRVQPEATPGEKVVAWLASEQGCVCKRLKGRGKKRWLEGAEEWRHDLQPGDVVFGVIIGVIRRERP
jgi:repressor LexA